MSNWRDPAAEAEQRRPPDTSLRLRAAERQRDNALEALAAERARAARAEAARDQLLAKLAVWKRIACHYGYDGDGE